MIGYRRVSSDRQGESGAGLAAQTATCEAAHEITEWHEDVESGSGRKALTGRDNALQRARETGLPIVVAKLDRLTRSVVDFYEINEHSRKHGHGLIILDVALDTRTPMGEAMAGMVAVFAQLERRRISERTKEAMQALAASGEPWISKNSGKLVEGFGRKPTIPQWVKDEARALLEADVSPSVIARRLPISRASVYALRG